MKRIVLLSLASFAVIGSIAYLNHHNSFQPETNYLKADFSFEEVKSASDTKDWMDARYTNPETGEKFTTQELNEMFKEYSKMPKTKAISWFEQGPDNIGGRTRAIQPDKITADLVWAGGVSGGLFKSINGANNWTRVESYIDAGASPFISSMCQFTDGTLFVATGSKHDLWNGNGVWYTTDQGVSWSQVPGTSGFTQVNEIVAPEGGTTLWLTGASNGLKKWHFGDASLTDITPGPGSADEIACSPDGQVMMVALNGTQVYVSKDSGNSWVDKSGPQPGEISISGVHRVELAISPDLNSQGAHSLYVVRNTYLNLAGMNVSHDNGDTWNEFMGSSSPPSNLNIYNNQAFWNSVISVEPGNPEKILLGGLDIWKWEQTVNNPPSGGFEQLTQWFLAPSSPKYAHADNHEMKWDGNKLYLGNDGGVAVSYNTDENWYPTNRGYGVTQFYGIAFDKEGSVMGGTQDNGTLYNNHLNATYQEFREVSGGDGFQCEISFFNPDVFFTTSQYNGLLRTGDGGQTMNTFQPTLPFSYDAFGVSTNGHHPFHSRIFMAEHYDLNSEDSVVFIPGQNYDAGSTIMIPSAATGDSIAYTTPTALYYDDTLNYDPNLSATETSVVNQLTGQIVYLDLYNWSHLGTAGSGGNPPAVNDSLLVDFPGGTDTIIVQSVGTFTHYYGSNPNTGQQYDMELDSVAYNIAWDTLTVQDPYQSWFLLYINQNGGELWGTRNAARLSAPDAQWGIIAQGIGGGTQNTIDVEFSRDLNQIYVSTGGSTIRRIDGLGSIYTSNPGFDTLAFHTTSGAPFGTSVTTINPGIVSEGIATNPNNPNDLVIVSMNGQIRRSSNATDPTPTFSALATLSGILYDVIIDRDDPDILIVGHNNGVAVTETGGLTSGDWFDASQGFLGTPVYEVRQNWRTWNEGNNRPGEVYIGTHGRGIWSSESYLAVDDFTDQSNHNSFEESSNLTVFPNPTVNSATIKFTLDRSDEVQVYVYSLSGRLIHAEVTNLLAGEQSIALDGSMLSKGTYLVKLLTSTGQTSAKFIKR